MKTETRSRKTFPTEGIYRCSTLDRDNYLTDDDARRFRYVKPADNARSNAYVGDCWIVDKDGHINPGTSASPLPIRRENIGRRVDRRNLSS